jgi:probable addiction module antidote protein
MIKTSEYDSAEFLTTPEALEFYMAEALESGDAALIVHALGVVARANSMSDIAKKTGLARENLYKALSASGRPEFATVMRVINALGLTLTIQPSPGKGAKGKARKRTPAAAS